MAEILERVDLYVYLVEVCTALHVALLEERAKALKKLGVTF